jgi:hypothetical protein
VTADPRDLGGDPGRRQDEIDAAGGDGALRHASVLGGIVLREGDAALGLDRIEAGRAVGQRAREDDADRAVVALLGERAEEGVDRVVRAGMVAGVEAEPAPGEEHRAVRRDHIDVIGPDLGLVDDLFDRHRGLASEDLGEHARVVGGQVLHEHERHAGVLGKARRRRFSGSRPPAEAPIPTTGKSARASSGGVAGFCFLRDIVLPARGPRAREGPTAQAPV